MKIKVPGTLLRPQIDFLSQQPTRTHTHTSGRAGTSLSIAFIREKDLLFW